jgi:hypothetical protein
LRGGSPCVRHSKSHVCLVVGPRRPSAAATHVLLAGPSAAHRRLSREAHLFARAVGKNKFARPAAAATTADPARVDRQPRGEVARRLPFQEMRPASPSNRVGGTASRTVTRSDRSESRGDERVSYEACLGCVTRPDAACRSEVINGPAELKKRTESDGGRADACQNSESGRVRGGTFARR